MLWMRAFLGLASSCCTYIHPWGRIGCEWTTWYLLFPCSRQVSGESKAFNPRPLCPVLCKYSTPTTVLSCAEKYPLYNKKNAQSWRKIKEADFPLFPSKGAHFTHTHTHTHGQNSLSGIRKPKFHAPVENRNPDSAACFHKFIWF